jgi:uncharacterized phiE125 gp8 family phage protein
MTLKVVTAPAWYPVSRAAAKEWCRIESDDTSQDGLIDLLRAAIAPYAENLTGRAFVERTLRLTFSGWPKYFAEGGWVTGIRLQQPPLVGVTAITYLDTTGAVQTLSADQYTVHDWCEPALIVPARNVIWPSLDRAMDAVRVTYVAGYAAVGSPQDEAAHQAGQPPQLKIWSQARIATLYENREQLVVGNVVQIPRDFCDGLLDSLVIGDRLVA